MIAYQTAYLKTHFPSQFMAAWLTSEQSRDIEKVSFALQECERMGLKVLPPDVNESFANFGVVTDKESKRENIRFGLGAIKNVGYGVAVFIVQERKNGGPYTSIADFVQRLDPKVINRKTIESLAQAGAFDRFAERNAVLLGIEVILKYSQLKNQNNGQIGLFDIGSGSEEMPALSLPQTSPATKQQKLLWEKELLGIYLSEHPLLETRGQLSFPVLPLNEVDDNRLSQNIRVMGIVTASKQILTKSNQAMAFVKIEDTTANLEVIVFPNLFTETKAYWDNDHILVIDGKVDNKDGTMKILANAAWDITDNQNLSELSLPEINQNNGNGSRNKPPQPLVIKQTTPIDKTSQLLELTVPRGTNVGILNDVKKILEEYPGQSPIILRIPINGGYNEIRAKIAVTVCPLLIHRIEKLVGANCIKILSSK